MSRCRDIVIAGDFAYIAAGFDGLVVVDISDPTNPTRISSTSFGYGYDISVAGNYAFVSDEWYGLRVIDISNPANPLLVGGYPTTYGGSHTISGNWVYLMDKYLGQDTDMLVLDITDPTNPVLVSVLDTDGSCGYCNVCGDFLYTLEWVGGNSRLLVVDISDPAKPAVLDMYETNAASVFFTPFGEYGFIGAGTSGVQVVRIAEPVLPPVPAGHVNMSGRSLNVKVHGDYAYLGVYLGNQGIQVIDISDPTNLVHVGSCSTPDGVPDIHIEGDYAYAPSGVGLSVFDISNPISPIHVGTCNTPNSAYGLDVAGDYVFIADNPGFQVIDISDPVHPVLAGGCSTSGSNHEVLVAGNYAYVSGFAAGLEVIDISNPISPIYLGSFPSGDAIDLAIAGDYAYMATSDAGLQVYDISNPLSPTIVGVYDPGDRVVEVAISGDYAYLACWFAGFHVVDISNPANPVVVGVFSTPDVAHGVDVAGDYVYLADNNYGMYAIQVFQRTLDTASDTGMSLAVNDLKEDIAKVQLSTTDVGTISWSVSADNGAHWEPIVPGAGWHSFTHTGSELMWKSQHVYDFTQPDVNPTCSSLEMEWIYSHVEVGFDIKPRSCPNPFNIKWLENIDQGNENEHALPKKGGVMPAAIVGSESFNVTEIDVSTLFLEGVEPLRSSYEDVARPALGNEECDCTTGGPDEIMDLTLKFSGQEIASTFGPVEDGDVLVLTITGLLLDGTPFEASDCVTILNKQPRPPLYSGPDQVVVYPAVPNPFNPVTRIRYALPREEFVKLSVYNVAGRLLERLVLEVQPAGEHVVEWNAKGLSSGIYFYRIEVGNLTETRKLILLK
jgi:hypothetical protein